MKVEIVRTLQQKDANVCLFSKEAFNSLKLIEGVKYNIHLGQSTESVKISLNNAEGNVMIITNKIFDEFFIFEGLKLNIRREEEDIYLGPVVGEFLTNSDLRYYRKGIAPVYHGRGALLENCLLYVFSLYDIDWESGKIRGYTLLPGSEKWVRGWFPMPDIIYDRAAGFREEERYTVKQIRKIFSEALKIKFINSQGYLGKKTTYKKLSKFPKVYKFLPRTVSYTSFDDLISMLKKYDFIFLKASLGSCGRQVLSIEKEGKKYRLTFYSGELKQIILSNIDELRNYVEKYTEEGGFIVQEGIRLLKYRGGVFDLRILVIKDKEGKWKVINKWGRIAKPSYTITNYSTGGGLDFYEYMYPKLRKSYTDIKVPDEQEVDRVTIMLAEYIEKALGCFGEIGMDIGIDIHGKLWLIEANAKPNKDLVEGFDDFDGIPLQNSIVFEYAKYLTNFKD